MTPSKVTGVVMGFATDEEISSLERTQQPLERVYDVVIRSLAVDPGLQDLLPYFTQFIRDEVHSSPLRSLTAEVTRHLHHHNVLTPLMKVAHAILTNPHFHIEPYVSATPPFFADNMQLDQLIPPVMTCIVSKRLSRTPTDDHWRLRDFAAEILGAVVKRCGGLVKIKCLPMASC
jgi:transcription initiation factor TFIID subunit 6